MADPRTRNIYFVTNAVQLMEEANVEAFMDAIRAAPAKPKLVVIDTFARSLVGGDENSAKDVGKAIAGADRLRQEFGCAVLLVHHTGKNGDQERGSSALRAAADAMLKLTADDGALTLSCEKMKDAAPFETEYLRLQATEDGETCIVKPSSGSPVVAGQLTKNHRLVLEALHDLPDGEASWSRIQKTSAVAEGSLARILSGLVKRGFIEKEKRHYALTERGRTHVS